MSKILITGGAGFIGSQLAHKLWQEGNEVVLLDNFSYGKEDNLIFDDHDFRKEVIREDICHADFINKLFAENNFEYVYHVAAITPLPDCQIDPGKAYHVNVAGTAIILEAARFFGCRKVIFASTSAVYENCHTFPTAEGDAVQPSLIYSSSKFAAEKLCACFTEVYGLSTTVLRFANVFGPHIDCLRLQPPVAGYVIRELFNGRPPVMHGSGDQERDFIYVDDLIDLAIRVQQGTGFDIVNVSSNETHSINELVDIITKYMHREDLKAEHVNSSHYWVNYPRLYEGVYPISNQVLDNEVLKHTLCDNNHAKEKYGWQPQVGFAEGLHRTVDYSVEVLSKAAQNG